MKILEVTNLSKTYGTGETQVKALDNVSLSVESGEFVAAIIPTQSYNRVTFILQFCHDELF